jgi:hypothetical protein
MVSCMAISFLDIGLCEGETDRGRDTTIFCLLMLLRGDQENNVEKREKKGKKKMQIDCRALLYFLHQ